MHKEDKEIYDIVSQAEIPTHSVDLPERIIAHAIASQHTQPPEVKTDAGFSAWWHGMKAQHGQKMAVAAALAAICIIIFNPLGKVTEHYIASRQVANAEERYYVNGVPLLADLTLMEEQDLRMEEVVIFAGQG